VDWTKNLTAKAKKSKKEGEISIPSLICLLRLCGTVRYTWRLAPPNIGVIMEKTVLKVEGMSCEHCVKAVTKAACSLAGVKKAEVDLKGGTVALEYDSAKTTLDEVKAAIVDQGYEVV
jgi:copper chaperone